MDIPPPKVTRLSVVLATIHMIRAEKIPPLAKYAILLTLAGSTDVEGNPVGLSSHQITKEMGDESPPTSSIGRLVDEGKIERRSTGGRSGVYLLTNKGKQEVARLLSGKRKFADERQPDMSRVVAATRA